ncbi:MAG: FAD-dependent oxidoreductase, partial [Nocardioides sp.]
RRVGVVTGWPRQQLAEVATATLDAGIRAKIVPPSDFTHLRFPAESHGVLELDAGVLLADRVLGSAARWLAGHPAARLRPHCVVSSVDADAGRVVLADGTIEQGDVVLVAGGPWSRALVDLPTVVYRQTMVYLRPPVELAGWWDAAPSGGGLGADGRGWLVPSGDGTLLKVSTAAVCRVVSGVDDDEDTSEPEWLEQILAAGIVPDIDRYAVAAVKDCHYAVGASANAGQFVRVGSAGWARAASGGDGFRTAPLVAEQLVNELVNQLGPIHLGSTRSGVALINSRQLSSVPTGFGPNGCAPPGSGPFGSVPVSSAHACLQSALVQ